MNKLQASRQVHTYRVTIVVNQLLGQYRHFNFTGTKLAAGLEAGNYCDKHHLPYCPVVLREVA